MSLAFTEEMLELPSDNRLEDILEILHKNESMDFLQPTKAFKGHR